MRKIIYIFCLALFLFISGPSDQAFAEKEIITFNSLAILPFHDYTSSDYSYLTGYLQELLYKTFNKIEELKILEPKRIDKYFKTNGIKSGSLYKDADVTKLATSLEVDACIVGRYIISGDKIRIQYAFHIKATGKIIQGKELEYTLNSSFLSNMDDFPFEVIEWAVKASPNIPLSILSKDEDRIFFMFLNRLRNSPVGGLVKNKWVFAIAIIALFILIARIVVFFFEKVLKKWTSKTETTIDDDIVEVTERPVKWIILFSGLKLAILSLAINASSVIWIDNGITAVIIILLSRVTALSSDVLIRHWGSKFREGIDPRVYEDLVPLFVTVSKILIFSFGFIMILSRFDIDVAPLIASLGIAGFAIGFAVKDTLANVIGGVVLILDRSFSVGDKVTIDGDTGIIKEVGLRNTMLRTYDHEIIVIPNGELINKKFKNFVLPDPQVRVVVNFGVVYGTNVDEVERVVLTALNSIEDKCTDPGPLVIFNKMGDFSLDFEAKFWVPDWANQYMKRIEATKVVYNALNEAGISIPFPTHTVYLEKEESKE